MKKVNISFAILGIICKDLKSKLLMRKSLFSIIVFVANISTAKSDPWDIVLSTNTFRFQNLNELIISYSLIQYPIMQSNVGNIGIGYSFKKNWAIFCNYYPRDIRNMESNERLISFETSYFKPMTEKSDFTLAIGYANIIHEMNGKEWFGNDIREMYNINKIFVQPAIVKHWTYFEHSLSIKLDFLDFYHTYHLPKSDYDYKFAVNDFNREIFLGLEPSYSIRLKYNNFMLQGQGTLLLTNIKTTGLPIFTKPTMVSSELNITIVYLLNFKK